MSAQEIFDALSHNTGKFPRAAMADGFTYPIHLPFFATHPRSAAMLPVLAGAERNTRSVACPRDRVAFRLPCWNVS